MPAFPLNGSTATEDDFEQTSGGTANKVPVTKTGGKLDSSFLPAPVTYKVILTSRSDNASSGDQVIAHGLSTAPTKVRITVRGQVTSGTDTIYGSDGAWDGATQASVYFMGASGSYGASKGRDGSNIVHMQKESSSQVASIAVDATNITLSWTKTNGFDGQDMEILIEAETNY